jgi:DNA-directed RNA polymerase subunit beta'
MAVRWQSIGEPGTQLTMRTFHTGGVAAGKGESSDITAGLPRVVELFEARTPKGKAVLVRNSGVLRFGEDDGKTRQIVVVGDDGTEEPYTVSANSKLQATVRDGAEIAAGDSLNEGPLDPKELLEIKGLRACQEYLVDQVQRVYRDQGVSIHDKHIELIVRQMLKRVAVQESGESTFLPGERVEARIFALINRDLRDAGKVPADARPELMGITKASLATDSWLSAASFQETTRVLTEAAIEGRSDSLVGLKENIIIGKLIPAGTGMLRYREIDVNVSGAAELLPQGMPESPNDLAAWLASIGSSQDAAAALPVPAMSAVSAVSATVSAVGVTVPAGPVGAVMPTVPAGAVDSAADGAADGDAGGVSFADETA